MFGKHVEGVLKYASWIVNRLNEVDFIQVYAGNKMYGSKHLSRPEKGVNFPAGTIVLKHTNTYSFVNILKVQRHSIQQTVNALSLCDDLKGLGFLAATGRSTTQLKKIETKLSRVREALDTVFNIYEPKSKLFLRNQYFTKEEPDRLEYLIDIVKRYKPYTKLCFDMGFAWAEGIRIQDIDPSLIGMVYLSGNTFDSGVGKYNAVGIFDKRSKIPFSDIEYIVKEFVTTPKLVLGKTEKVVDSILLRIKVEFGASIPCVKKDFREKFIRRKK